MLVFLLLAFSLMHAIITNNVYTLLIAFKLIHFHVLDFSMLPWDFLVKDTFCYSFILQFSKGLAINFLQLPTFWPVWGNFGGRVRRLTSYNESAIYPVPYVHSDAQDRTHLVEVFMSSYARNTHVSTVVVIEKFPFRWTLNERWTDAEWTLNERWKGLTLNWWMHAQPTIRKDA